MYETSLRITLMIISAIFSGLITIVLFKPKYDALKKEVKKQEESIKELNEKNSNEKKINDELRDKFDTDRDTIIDLNNKKRDLEINLENRKRQIEDLRRENKELCCKFVEIAQDCTQKMKCK